MRKAVVVIADERFLAAACCTLLSCSRFGDVGDDSSLFLISNSVSAAEVERAEAFFFTRDVPVLIIGYDPPVSDYRADSRVTAAAYTRLHLDEFFDNDWDRVLYLDADTRVCAPLRPLLQTDLRGQPLGAIHDTLQYISDGAEKSRIRLSLKKGMPYFNSGVLLFDWPAVKKSNYLEHARQFARYHGDLCLYYDQCALNKAFERSWTPLDPRWNTLISIEPLRIQSFIYHQHIPAGINPRVLHYIGATKPWMRGAAPGHLEDLGWYAEVLRDSPWPYFVSSEPDMKQRSTGQGDGSHGLTGDLRVSYLMLCDRLSRIPFMGRLFQKLTFNRLALAAYREAAMKQKRKDRELSLLITTMIEEAESQSLESGSGLREYLKEQAEIAEAAGRLDDRTLYCIEMPSAIFARDEFGIRRSTGKPGYLVHGPYAEVQEEGCYSAELIYSTRSRLWRRAGAFDVTVSKLDRSGKQSNFTTLSNIELKPTWGRAKWARMEFDTTGYRGWVLETRVYVRGNVDMRALAINIRRAETAPAPQEGSLLERVRERIGRIGRIGVLSLDPKRGYGTERTER